MSTRNPMNDRYTGEGPKGQTRKSASAAKPKSKAASTVIIKSNKKTEKEKKAERKAQRRAENERQREIDRKYYKPDTPRYKRYRILFYISLILSGVFIVLMFLFQDLGGWASILFVILAYSMIIVSFYIDYALVRKERRAYQERMLALEAQEARHNRELKSRGQAPKATPKKVSGKNATRNPKKQAEAAARNAEAAEAAEEGVEESKAKKRFGLFRSKAQDAPSAESAESETKAKA